MSKRKLNYLNFDDVIVPISLVLIESWIDCGSNTETMSTAASVFGEGMETDKMNEPPTLDKDFLTSLRDLKVKFLEYNQNITYQIQLFANKADFSVAFIDTYFHIRLYKKETKNIGTWYAQGFKIFFLHIMRQLPVRVQMLQDLEITF